MCQFAVSRCPWLLKPCTIACTLQASCDGAPHGKCLSRPAAAGCCVEEVIFVCRCGHRRMCAPSNKDGTACGRSGKKHGAGRHFVELHVRAPTCPGIHTRGAYNIHKRNIVRLAKPASEHLRHLGHISAVAIVPDQQSANKKLRRCNRPTKNCVGVFAATNNRVVASRCVAALPHRVARRRNYRGTSSHRHQRAKQVSMAYNSDGESIW